jgi:hypothetical protein
MQHEPTACIICGNLHTNRFHDHPGRYCDTCYRIKKDAKGTLTEIDKNLYLGDMVAAANFDGDRLCVYDHAPTYKGTAIHAPILKKPPNGDIDRTGAEVDIRMVMFACDIISAYRAFRRPLLVHCFGGVERSPLVIAYYAVHARWVPSLDAAYQYLKEQRPVVSDRSFWLPSDHYIIKR